MTNLVRRQLGKGYKVIIARRGGARGQGVNSVGLKRVDQTIWSRGNKKRGEQEAIIREIKKPAAKGAREFRAMLEGGKEWENLGISSRRKTQRGCLKWVEIEDILTADEGKKRRVVGRKKDPG